MLQTGHYIGKKCKKYRIKIFVGIWQKDVKNWLTTPLSKLYIILVGYDKRYPI
jgi:hypothetical protein